MFGFGNHKNSTAAAQVATRRKLVVFTGAGMSAESGLATFRGNGGLWENHDVRDVASPQAWRLNPNLVLRFYNERRRQMRACKPNAGHHALVELEKHFEVDIITQNVDDLHERAGSSRVLHLHGELGKVRSCKDPSYVKAIDGDEIHVGDLCPAGGQLRPHIVWFGEDVPLFGEAVSIAETADLFVVIGSSLAVYPAASLIDYVRSEVPVFLIDPEPTMARPGITILKMGAGEGVRELHRLLLPSPAR